MKEIELKGTIVSNDEKWIYEWMDIESTSPKDIQDGLKEADGDDVTIMINSGGGDVFAGNEMYYHLARYKGHTIAEIMGVAASAATIVCCGADTVRASPGAQYMIHNVWSIAQGDYHAMDGASQMLLSANRSIANVYMQKTGKTEKELLKLMDSTTWMDAKKALELGFIDDIIGESPFNDNIYNAICTVLTESQKNSIRRLASYGETPKLAKQKQELEVLRLKRRIP